MQFIADKSITALALNNAMLRGAESIYVKQTVNSVIFESSNEYNAIRVMIDKEVDPSLELRGSGEYCTNPSVLLAALKGTDTDTVKVESKDTYTIVKGDKSKTKINNLPYNSRQDFFIKPETKIELSKEMIGDIVKSVSFAVSDSQNNRPVLTGVNFECDGMRLTATATDSYRLAQKHYDMPFEKCFSITLPSKALSTVKTLFNDENVTMYINDNVAIFEGSNITFRTTLLAGKYPDVERLIPVIFEQIMTINRVDLLDALNRILFIKTDQQSIVKLTVNSIDKMLYASNQEIGEASERLDGVKFEGESLSISFNALFMKQALEGLNGETVSIKFSGDLKPFIVEDGDNVTTQLMLPIKTLS